MMERQYKYYAFISYSHEDEKWAKWLHRKLESYRLPNTVVREAPVSIPRNIRPVFRDQTDIGVGPLRETLHRELEDSRYLIVICSPRSAQSEWVNREVRHFQEMGRGERIIPFIVEGSPDTDTPGQQCYPPALLDTEDLLLGVSLGEHTREEALVKTIAHILGLKYDQLYQRHRRREQKRRAAWGMISGLFLLAAALAGDFAWDYYVPKHAYYVDYVERRLIPEGIYPLDGTTRSRRNRCYHFIYQYHQLQRVIHENSAGTPMLHEDTEYLDRPMILHLVYTDTGELLRREFHDRNGKILLIQRIEHPLTSSGEKEFCFVDLIDSTGSTKPLHGSTSSMDLGSLGINGVLSPQVVSKSSIGRQKVWFDKAGFSREVNYLRDSYNTPMPDAEGIFGIACEYDELGRVSRLAYLDHSGNPTTTKIGLAGKQYRYDERGNPISTKWVDLQGEGVLNAWGAASEVAEYDAYGNRISGVYFGIDDQPSICKYGYAEYKLHYDARGNMTCQDYLGLDGKPVVRADGYAAYRANYDDRGNLARIEYYGADGKITITGYGYAALELSYDGRGNPVRLAYFGVDGKPVVQKNGYASTALKYDKQGNVTYEASFDTEGKPMLNDQGFAAFKRGYDERGNTDYESFLDADGKPTLHEDGFSTVKLEHDQRGNITKQSYFDSEGKLVMHKYGNAIVEFKYDDQGNQIRQEYKGLDGSSTICRGGFATVEWKYESGNKTHEAYFDTALKLTINSDGYAAVSREYDQSGNVIHEIYLGVDEKPILILEGYAEVTREYDKQGRETGQSFFGVLGEPTFCSFEFASSKTVYNERGNIIQRNYFGADGTPCLNKSWVHEERFTYDVLGNCTDATFYGLDGKPCIEQNLLISRWEKSYDERSNEIRRSYFDSNGYLTNGIERFATTLYTYDERDRLVREEYLGPDGLPTVSVNNYASIVNQYDNRGNHIKSSVFDVDGNPCTEKNTEASIVIMEYDERNQLLCKKYYDVFGNPTISNLDFCHSLRNTYNNTGGIVRIECLDEEGRLRDASPYPAREYKYNTYGYVSSVLYYDSTNKLRSLLHAEERFKYDKYGKETEISYWDFQGQPITSTYPPCAHRIVQCRDEKGKCTEKTFFGIDNNLTDSSDGIARITTKYDDKGRIIESRYYDTSNHLHAFVPTLGEWRGFAGLDLFYDARGKPIKITYIGENALPAPTLEGPTSVCYAYDTRGREVKREYLDVAGGPTPYKPTGAAGEIREYDSRGNLKTLVFLDTQGAEIHHKTFDYDEYDMRSEFARSYQEGEVIPISILCIPQDNGRAQDLGVRAGDIILEFCDWAWFQDMPVKARFKALAETLNRFSDEVKRLVVARANTSLSGTSSFDIYTFEFPPGPMGIQVVDSTADLDWESLEEAYKAWKYGQKPIE